MYSPRVQRAMYSLNPVFSPYDYVDIIDHFGKLMKLSTNISMAALAKACRLVDTMQKRRIGRVDQYLIVYSIQGKSSHN